LKHTNKATLIILKIGYQLYNLNVLRTRIIPSLTIKALKELKDELEEIEIKEIEDKHGKHFNRQE
jgi:hypothetical protein